MNQNLSMNMAGAYHERVVLLFGIERVNENYKTSPFELFSSQKMPFYREDIWWCSPMPFVYFTNYMIIYWIALTWQQRQTSWQVVVLALPGVSTHVVMASRRQPTFSRAASILFTLGSWQCARLNLNWLYSQQKWSSVVERMQLTILTDRTFLCVVCISLRLPSMDPVDARARWRGMYCTEHAG